MFPRSLTPAMLLLAAFSAPAFAQTARTPFSDLPAGHWAEAPVHAVAVERAFMKGYPDGTFQGDRPFTRIQLALAVNELLRGLEADTKLSWQTQGLGGYAFQDLPADPEVQTTVLRLANDYRLFEAMPGVTSRTFEGEKQVTRYEMAKVVHRLLRLGEERGVVDPGLQTPHAVTFSDLPRSAWPYEAVKEVSERYQVMVGFPDGTFRGPEELTRYQFAASAAQTFPLVKALVERTQEHKDRENAERSAGSLRFMESTPVWLGATAHTSFPGVAGLGGRYAHYMGPLFLLADLDVGLPLKSGDRLYGGGANFGYAIPLGAASHLQPHLGVRVLGSGAFTLGGLSYGLVASHRPAANWALFGRFQGTAPLGATVGSPLGVFLGGASLGLQYDVTPQWGLTFEGGYALTPSLSGTAYTADGTPTVSLGVAFRPW